NAITIMPPSGFSISLTSGTGFVSSPNVLTIDHVSGEVPPTTIYVRMQSSQAGPMQGAISHESVGASAVQVNVEGSVIAEEPTVQGTMSVISVSSNTIELAISPGDGQARMILAKAGVPV